MTDDLVKRLLEMCGDDGILAMRDIYDTDVAAAADRIEQLEKYASLHAKCEQASLELEQKLMNRLRDAHKRIEELEYALRSIAETPIGAEIPDRTTIWGLAVYMRETAKDALKEGDDEQ